MWICVVVCVSAWTFFLGVMVERGKVPVRFDIKSLEGDLTRLKEADIRKEHHRFAMAADPEKQKPELGFHEALKKRSPKPAQKRIENKPKAPKQQTRAPKKKEPPPKTVKPAPAPKSKAAAPKAAQQEKDIDLTIQVASLRDPKKADEQVARLKKRGYAAYRIIGAVPGMGIWYRVRIGQFKSRAAARSTLDRLKKDRIPAFLVNL